MGQILCQMSENELKESKIETKERKKKVILFD
jgi:hypothetical protein